MNIRRMKQPIDVQTAGSLFSPNRCAERHRFAYYPFGAGPRLCLGEQYAMTEMQLVLATITQTVRLDLVPGYPVVPRAMVGIRPLHPLRMMPVMHKRPELAV